MGFVRFWDCWFVRSILPPVTTSTQCDLCGADMEYWEDIDDNYEMICCVGCGAKARLEIG